MTDQLLHRPVGSRVRVLVPVVDPDRLARVTKALTGAGMEVIESPSLEAARAAIPDARPDLLVTDDLRADGEIGGPFRELLDVGEPPIIVIAESDVAGVMGLEAGAADYLVEPFVERELRARAWLRCRPAEGSVVVRGDLQIDRAARRVRVRGAEIDLTPREYDLLEFLAIRPMQAFSREQLLRDVWGASPDWQELDTVTEHVYRLRHKIEQDPKHPQWLTTVRGTGYRFDV